ncbi:MAG: bifunctional oligoribonuclease/PAP phosphatase NrnA [Vicinamibacterales bacterium]
MNRDLNQIVDAIRAGRRFVIASHARPDGDAIGSEMAAAYALRALGKHVRVVSADPPPAPFLQLPGVPDIEVASEVSGEFDVSIIMECSSLARTGVKGLDRGMVINIDHHAGNSQYGQLNWFDGTAAACGEMVFDLVRALGAPLTREVATHIYVAILTDTGSFHFSSISPRTFDICREALTAGVDPVQTARFVYDSNSLGRLKIFGAVLSRLQIDPTGRIAALYLDEGMLREAGGTADDTEGLINEPLTVKDIQAVVFFKHVEGDEYRVSMRSKGDVDIAAIAKQFGGGGHKNAAGCSASGPFESLRRLFVARIQHALELQDVRIAGLKK